MYEWQIVALAGALGGFLSTFFPGGMDVPSPPLIRSVVECHRGPLFCYHAVRNILCGAIASYLVWSGNSSGLSSVVMNSTDWTPIQAGTSLIIGGAGTKLISGAFRQARTRGIDNIAASLEETVERNAQLQKKIAELEALLTQEGTDDA